jgi:hypothetical protein
MIFLKGLTGRNNDSKHDLPSNMIIFNGKGKQYYRKEGELDER